MFGGWGKMLVKNVEPNKELYPNTNIIKSISGFTIYDETKKYLKIVNTLGDLKILEPEDVNDGDIFYVNDITNFNEYYPTQELENATNYFIIENSNNYDIYGEDGWKNITKEAVNTLQAKQSPIQDVPVYSKYFTAIKSELSCSIM